MQPFTLERACRSWAVELKKAVRSGPMTRRSLRHSRVAWSIYGLLGSLLGAYLVGLVVAPTLFNSLAISGWGVISLEVAAASLCFGRAVLYRRNRAMAICLGLALLTWTMGDVMLTIESLGGKTPGSPSLADLFYLGFYPLAYVALALVMRRETTKLIPATWLDGLVAGLGAAGIAACFVFPVVAHNLGGSALGNVVDLAYPTGDLVLLALVIGGTATFMGRLRAHWVVFGLVCLVVAAGDTFNLFSSQGGGNGIGNTVNDIAWLTAILLLSFSLWLPVKPDNLFSSPKAPGFVLPGLGALAALVILFVGTREVVSGVALGLAVATLVVVGARLLLSARQLQALTASSRQQSVTDDLTNLANRRKLFSILDSYFANVGDPQLGERHLSLLFLDLDHFKEINDSFGHSAGDELLRVIGPRMSEGLRTTDLLVRLGGDEFGVIIMDSEPAYVEAVAKRLMSKLAEPFCLNGVTVRVSGSVGIASAPQDATDSVRLLRCADLAMYRAKSSESRVEVYRAEVDEAGNRLRLVDELREAIAEQKLVLHYQPQMNMRTGEIAAVEALLRWPHPRLGMVSPLEFLPLAEEAGLMQPLTTMVLEQALSQCAQWQTAGIELTVSVNASISNLLDPGFVKLVRTKLEEHALEPSSLIIEITETSVIGDFAACRSVVARLRELGVGVSIDDFGAGFTSLAYLGKLAVSELKLDRSFITDLASEAGNDLDLVRATVDLGHALGLYVVAEGIEDSRTLDLLTEMGCDLSQGYFTGKPMPADELSLLSKLRFVADSELAMDKILVASVATD